MIEIKAMLGMLGGGENMSENLSGCSFILGISLHRGTGVGVGRGLPVGMPANSLAHRLLN